MADFSLTTLFVAPVGQTTLPSSGSTQDLTPGQLGLCGDDYTLVTDVSTFSWFQVCQGRENTYLQGSKRSDKIAENGSNVLEWYKVEGNPQAINQITEITALAVKPLEDVSITIRAHSSYIDTLFHNGFTRSITIPGECLTCGGDPCTEVADETVIDNAILEFAKAAPGVGPDNINFDTFFRFEKIGTDKLVIEGKPLTAYGEACDVSAYPHEYDRMWFEVFVYKGPATTADFISADVCDSVATVTTTQESNYPSGTSEEIKQLEKNFHSYQAGYLKHLHKRTGYNQNFESQVTDGTNYTTFYLKFNDYDRSAQNWSDYVPVDSTVIIAVEAGGALETALEAALETATGLADITDDNTPQVSTTTTTTTV